MILYHGSSIEVREPKLLKIQRDLDFGRGFYTASDLDQAAKWAKRTALKRRSGSAFVSVYEADDQKLSALKILRFMAADAERAIFDMWEAEDDGDAQDRRRLAAF